MRAFCLLFAALAFASEQYGAQQSVTREILGKTWTRIFSCTQTNQKNADVLPNIPELAKTATQVLITHTDGYTERYVYSQPDTYPIKRLRAGQTLSFQTPSAPSIYASQDVVQKTWVGPSDLLARLWNSCGEPSAIYSSGNFFWACNNNKGLHLNSKAHCMWDYSKKFQGPIEIYIDAGSRRDCETCRVYENKRWTRVYSCNNKDSSLQYSVAATIELAKKATQVLINNHYEDYVTSNPGSYPIQRLRLGQTVSHPLPPNNYAEKADIAANWQGPEYLTSRLWNTCGAAAAITDKMYWACNNQKGLHLAMLPVNDRCEWDYQNYDGPIEVFVDAPCTCPGEYVPPPPTQPQGGYY